MMLKYETSELQLKNQTMEESRIIASLQQIAVLGHSVINNKMGSTLNGTYFTLRVSSVVLLGD